MRGFTRVGLVLGFIFISAAALIYAAGATAPKWSVAAATIVAAQTKSDASQQGQNKSPCDGLAPDGTSDFDACAQWLKDNNYLIPGLWNWLSNNNIPFCVEVHGPPIIKHNENLQPTPICTKDCLPMGNPNDSSTHP